MIEKHIGAQNIMSYKICKYSTSEKRNSSNHLELGEPGLFVFQDNGTENQAQMKYTADGHQQNLLQ